MPSTSNMLLNVDNILLPIMYGTLLSLFFTFVMYILSLAFEIQMSARSFGYSVVLFLFTLWHGAEMFAGLSVKSNISEVEELVERQIPSGISNVTTEEFSDFVLQVHPKMLTLLNDVEYAPYNAKNTEEYVDELHSNLTSYILRKILFMVIGFLLIGTISILFAERRMSYNAKRRQRSSSSRVRTQRGNRHRL